MVTMVQSMRQQGCSSAFSFWGKWVIGLWLLGCVYTPTPAAAKRPIAYAGDDKCETIPEDFVTWSVTLDGSGSSDPDGDGITSYIWRRVKPPPPPNPASGESSAVNLGQGPYTFKLRVTDNTGATSRLWDKVKITMVPTTVAPDPGGGSGEEGLPVDVEVTVNSCSPGNQATARSRALAPAFVHFERRDFDADEGGGFVTPTGQVVDEVREPVNSRGVATARYKLGPRRVQRLRARIDASTSGQEAPIILTLEGPGNIAVEANGQLVVTDLRQNRVWRVDPVSGRSRVLSDKSSSGPPMFAPHAIAVVPADGTVVVTDHGDKRTQTPAQLLTIHPLSGERKLLSACAGRGKGPCFGSPVGVVVQPGVGVLVLDRAARDQAGLLSPAVIQVDASGDRQVIAANTFFDGRFFNSASDRIMFGFPQGMTLTPKGLAVVDGALPDPETPGKYEPGILYVDPQTGRRTLGPGNTPGVPFPFGSPVGIAAGDIALFVVDNDVGYRTLTGDVFLSQTILRLNPSTGARFPLASNFDRDNDVLLKFPYGIAVESDGTLVVVDVGGQLTPEPRVLRLHPVTGKITLVSGSDDLRGRGSRLQKPIDLTADKQGTLWVLDGQRGAFRVVQVHPDTGHREVISTPTSSGAYVLGAPVGITATKGALWVLDTEVMHRRLGAMGPGVFRVDRSSGELTLVFPPTPGTPSARHRLGNPVDLAAQDDGILWVLDQATHDAKGQDIGPAVWKIDPFQGVGKIVSSNRGDGLVFGKPVGIAVDQDGRNIWVADRDATNSAGEPGAVVWRVDPGDGERTDLVLQGAQQPLREPRDIAVDPVTGHLYTLSVKINDLSVFHTPGVWGIDPVAEKRFPVSGNQLFDHGFYARPQGIAVATQEYTVHGLDVRLFAVDTLLEAVVGVSLENCGTRPPPRPCGRRVIVSK